MLRPADLVIGTRRVNKTIRQKVPLLCILSNMKMLPTIPRLTWALHRAEGKHMHTRYINRCRQWRVGRINYCAPMEPQNTLTYTRRWFRSQWRLLLDSHQGRGRSWTWRTVQRMVLIWTRNGVRCVTPCFRREFKV